mgnify:CR=1 FL=1
MSDHHGSVLLAIVRDLRNPTGPGHGPTCVPSFADGLLAALFKPEWAIGHARRLLDDALKSGYGTAEHEHWLSRLEAATRKYPVTIENEEPQ